LHIHSLHKGVYIALMDKRPEVIQQGVRALAKRGVGTEFVGRLNWTTDSVDYGVLLVKVTDQPTRVMTGLAVTQSLLPLGQIFNGKTKGLAKGIYCGLYGPKKADNTRMTLGVVPEADASDYCTSRFQNLAPTVAALKVAITDQQPSRNAPLWPSLQPSLGLVEPEGSICC
jgi:hypothetical protein